MRPVRSGSVRDSVDDLVERGVLVELAAVVALLVGFHAGTIALAAVLDPYFLDSDTSLLFVRSALVLAGIAALVASYASWRGYSLPVSVPGRADRRLVGTAVVATVALATIPFFDLALRMDIGVGHVASTLADLGSVFTTRSLIRIALFVPGMALLYHGLIQGALRQVFDDRGRAVVVTTLLGGYLAAPTVATYGTFANGPWLYLWGQRAAVAILFVLALGVAVYADERSGDGTAHALARLPVLATLAFAVLVLAAEATSPGGAVVLATRTAVVGVAAYAYGATESLVVPALVYATFAAVSSVLYVSTITAAFGA